MAPAKQARGRPRKYAEYEKLLSSLPKPMAKRPKYVHGIGIFRGNRGDTAWIKVRLTNGAVYEGRTYLKGRSLEIKLGNLASWSWEQLEEKYREMQGKVDRGETLEDAPHVMFNDWAADWLERARTRVRDWESLHIHIHKHLLPSFGRKSLKAVTTHDINRWQSSQLKTLAPGTVKRQSNTLNAILNDARRAGHIDKSPCNDASAIKGINRRQRYLSAEELVHLLTIAEGISGWLADLILWLVHSGMRKGEVLALRWPDIQTLSNGRAIVQIHTSKSDQGRVVVCTETMNKILERQKERKREGDERVFPIAKMTLRRKWELARARAKLQDVTIHDLRRTHSTHAAVAGVDLRTLAGRLGHANLSMLEKHYAALVGSASEEAALKIERAFSPK